MFDRLTCKGENGTSGLGTKDDGGETDKELEHGVFMIGNTIATVPIELLVAAIRSDWAKLTKSREQYKQTSGIAMRHRGARTSRST